MMPLRRMLSILDQLRMPPMASRCLLRISRSSPLTPGEEGDVSFLMEVSPPLSSSIAPPSGKSLSSKSEDAGFCVRDRSGGGASEPLRFMRKARHPNIAKSVTRQRPRRTQRFPEFRFLLTHLRLYSCFLRLRCLSFSPCCLFPASGGLSFGSFELLVNRFVMVNHHNPTAYIAIANRNDPYSVKMQ